MLLGSACCWISKSIGDIGHVTPPLELDFGKQEPELETGVVSERPVCAGVVGVGSTGACCT